MLEVDNKTVIFQFFFVFLYQIICSRLYYCLYFNCRREFWNLSR